MTSKAASCILNWNPALTESVDSSQQWVLSAMARHGQGLIAMLWRILGNEPDVCDAYQETFLNLAHYQRGKKPDHVKAFLFRTASNTAISMLRRKLIEEKAFTKIAHSKNLTQNIDYAHQLDSQKLQQNLRLCISKLPEYLGSVLALRDLAELPYAQVGKILGISAAAARVYRYKAIQLLAVWMKDKNDDNQK